MLRTDLIDLVNSGDALCFVGSGSSIDAGYPSWSQLVERAVSTAQPAARARIESDPRYKRALADKDFPRCFTLIERELGRAHLEQIVVAELQAALPPSSAIKSIADWPFAGYVTSNYDMLLDRTLTAGPLKGWVSVGNNEAKSRQVV